MKQSTRHHDSYRGTVIMMLHACMNMVLCTAVIAMMLHSCTKAPINGDLDGFWQLTSIERLDDNGTVTSTSLQKNVFWSFQLHLMQLGNGEYFSFFENTGTTLRIYSLASASAHENASQNDEWLTESDLPALQKYGLFSLDTLFKIERLDDEAMTLRSEDARLTFRKY